MNNKLKKWIVVCMALGMVITCIPTTQVEAKTNWKKLYKKHIKEAYVNSNGPGLLDETEFFLKDVDGDKIPELFTLSGAGSGGTWANFCAIEGNKVWTEDTVYRGDFFTIPKKKMIFKYKEDFNTMLGGDVIEYRFYKKINGKWKVVTEGHSHGDEYFWGKNNKKVSKATYNKNLNKIIKGGWLGGSGLGKSYTYKQILKKLS